MGVSRGGRGCQGWGGGEVTLPVAGEGGGVEVQAAVGVVYIDRAARTTSSDTAIIRDYRGERKG